MPCRRRRRRPAHRVGVCGQHALAAEGEVAADVEGNPVRAEQGAGCRRGAPPPRAWPRRRDRPSPAPRPSGRAARRYRWRARARSRPASRTGPPAAAPPRAAGPARKARANSRAARIGPHRVRAGRADADLEDVEDGQEHGLRRIRLQASGSCRSTSWPSRRRPAAGCGR